MSSPKIVIKRFHDEPDPSDGIRVLVDRLWPRGKSKTAARLDEWLKDVAPSPELRSWWNHDVTLMDEFGDRYEQELADSDHEEAVRCLIGEVMTLGEAGLPTRDVLRAVTSRAADALGADRIGVLEAGRAADLLIVDGDPLTDLQALHEVMAVFRDGRVVVGDIASA